MFYLFSYFYEYISHKKNQTTLYANLLNTFKKLHKFPILSKAVVIHVFSAHTTFFAKMHFEFEIGKFSWRREL